MTDPNEDYDSPENRWERLAADKGYECSRCCTVIQYEERELYFERKLRANCANQIKKV